VRASLRYYVIAVTLAGPAAAALCAALGGWQEVASSWPLLWRHLLFFLVVGCLLDVLTVPMARGGDISAGFAAFLAALLVIGPLPASAVATAAVLVEGLLKRRAATKVVFNVGHTVLAMMAAGLVYYGLPGSARPGPHIGVLELPRAGAAALVLMLIQISAVSAAVCLERGLPLRRLWLGAAREVIPADLVLAGLGLLVAIMYLNRRIFGAGSIPFTVVILLVPSGLLYYASRLKSDMLNVYNKTLRAFGHVVEARLQTVNPDALTLHHGARVAALAADMAAKLPLTEEEVQRVRWAGELHDIGKAAVPVGAWAEAASGPDAASAASEYAETGYEMLREVEFLSLVRLFIRYHRHPYDDPTWRNPIGDEERHLLAEALPAWRLADGRPIARWDQPPADLILLGAQILHAADYYDSALGEDAREVLAYMQSESGRKFHPEVIAAMLRTVEQTPGAGAGPDSPAGREVHAV